MTSNKAKALAKDKNVGIGGASLAQQTLNAGLVDELYVHIAPILLGDGVRLFEHLAHEAIRLRKLGSLDAEDASHLRFEVLGHSRAHRRSRQKKVEFSAQEAVVGIR